MRGVGRAGGLWSRSAVDADELPGCWVESCGGCFPDGSRKDEGEVSDSFRWKGHVELSTGERAVGLTSRSLVDAGRVDVLRQGSSILRRILPTLADKETVGTSKSDDGWSVNKGDRDQQVPMPAAARQ